MPYGLKAGPARVDVDALRELLGRRDPRVTQWPTCGNCQRECILMRTRAMAEPIFGCCRNWRGSLLEPGLVRITPKQTCETLLSRSKTVVRAAFELRVGDDEEVQRRRSDH